MAPCLTTNSTRSAGSAQTMSGLTAGELYSGTPLMVRDTGCVGSVCSNGIFEPTVANALSVLKRQNRCGSGDERGHRGEQVLRVGLRRLECVEVGPRPAVGCDRRGRATRGRSVLAVWCCPKKLASNCLLTSRVIPSPTTDKAAGLESLASSELITDSAASFFGVTTCSVKVPSVAGISAPSATKLACGSVNTIGTLRSCDPIWITVLTWALTACSMTGRTTRSFTSAGDKIAPAPAV